MLRLWLLTALLLRRDASWKNTYSNVSASTTFLCAIAVAAVEKGYSFLFFGRGAAANNNFLLAALLVLLVLVLLTTSVLKQREVPATVSSFYVSAVCTAMLRTSIAAVVFG